MFAADSRPYGSIHSFRFSWLALKKYVFGNRMHNCLSRSSKVVDFGTNLKRVCDFLLVINSNIGSLSPFLRPGDLLTEKRQFSLSRSHLTPSLWVNSFEFMEEPYVPKTRVLGLSGGEDFLILTCVILTQCQRVTGRQRDGQTYRQL